MFCPLHFCTNALTILTVGLTVFIATCILHSVLKFNHSIEIIYAFNNNYSLQFI